MDHRRKAKENYLEIKRERRILSGRQGSICLENRFRHIASDNPASADKWVNEIEREIDSLEKFPSRCPVIPESQDLGKENRHIIYGNYRTIFRMEGLRVVIMRVIHGTRLLDLTVIQK